MYLLTLKLTWNAYGYTTSAIFNEDIFEGFSVSFQFENEECIYVQFHIKI